MKNNAKFIDVKFSGIPDYADEYNTQPGNCEQLVNLRERGDLLVAVGQCVPLGTFADGEKLVAVHYASKPGKNLISVIGGNRLYWHSTVAADGTLEEMGIELAAMSTDIIDVEAVGDFIVVATADENLVLRYDAVAECYEPMSIEDAVPRLLLEASGEYAVDDVVPAYEFDNPLAQWRRELSAADVSAISGLLSDVYDGLCRQATGGKYYVQPILARYAVRLWNDSYLWVSAPMLVGNGIQTVKLSTTATVGGNLFTGINAAGVSLSAYRLSVVVESGFLQKWDSLVKSIDILVTDEASMVDVKSQLEYTCSRKETGGTMVYAFDCNLPVAAADSVVADLLASERWHVVCSIYDFDSLRQGVVKASNSRLSANAIGLPSGVHRYEIIGRGGIADVQSEAIDGCISSSAGRYGYTSLYVHNRRLFAAGDKVRLVNPWHPSQFWHGQLSAIKCRVVVETHLKTMSGDAVTVWQGTSDFLPESLVPIISYPDSRATSVTISVMPTGGTMKRATAALYSVPGRGLSCNTNADMQPLEFVDTGISSLPVPQQSGNEESIAGQLIEYDELNPFYIARVHKVCGSRILAMASSSHHTNNNIGIPLYVFAADGTYAMPYRVATSQYSPAVIVSRNVADANIRPADGDDAVYFVTVRGDVCRLDKYSIVTLACGISVTSIAWNAGEHELWLGTDSGDAVVVMESGRRYVRNAPGISGLFHLSPTDAYAASLDGKLMDISHETCNAPVNVSLLTCPVAVDDVAAVPAGVVWKVFAEDASLTLALTGETGASCHGMTLCRLHVAGRLAAPLPMPVVAPPVRTVRLAIDGTVEAGTIFRPATIRLNPKRSSDCKNLF